jgi:hypothetical protein
LALAHGKHGERMAKVLTDNASSLKDRDKSEMRTSNHTKREFHEDDYANNKNIVRDIDKPTDYNEKDTPQVTMSDELWQKLQSIVYKNKNENSLVNLPSVFEDGLNLEMGKVVAEDEDDQILFETTDYPVDEKKLPQTHCNAIRNLSTSVPVNMDKASEVMSNMPGALRNGDIKMFDECDKLLLDQLEVEGADRSESE